MPPGPFYVAAQHSGGARHARDPRPSLAVPHLRRAFHGRGVERALPREPGARADRALGRLRSADADGLQQRPRAGARRGGPGRRARGASGRHARAVRGHPARADEHLHDDQRHRALAARALRGRGRGAGRGRHGAPGHRAERHREGISLPRDLHRPARAEPAPRHRRRRVDDGRHAALEPDERVLLPPAGGGGHAGAGAGLRTRHGHRGARRPARSRRRPSAFRPWWAA